MLHSEVFAAEKVALMSRYAICIKISGVFFNKFKVILNICKIFNLFARFCIDINWLGVL